MDGGGGSRSVDARPQSHTHPIIQISTCTILEPNNPSLVPGNIAALQGAPITDLNLSYTNLEGTCRVGKVFLLPHGSISVNARPQGRALLTSVTVLTLTTQVTSKASRTVLFSS